MVHTFLCLRQSASDDLSQRRQEGQPSCLAHATTSRLKQTCDPNPVGRTCRCEIILILRKLLMHSVNHEDIGQFGCSAEDICFRSRLLLGSNWECHSKALLRRKIRCLAPNLNKASQEFAMCACNDAKTGSRKYEAACQDLSQIVFVPFSPPVLTDPRAQEQLLLHSTELYKRYLHQWTQPGLRDYLLPETLRLNAAGLDRIPRMKLDLHEQRIEKMKYTSDRLLARRRTDSGSSSQSASSTVASAAAQSHGSNLPSKRKSSAAALDPSRPPSWGSSTCYINTVNVNDGAASGTTLPTAQEGIALASRAGTGFLQTPPFHLEETEQLRTTIQSSEEVTYQQTLVCERFPDARPISSLVSAPARPAFDLDQLFNADPGLHMTSDPVDQLESSKQGMNTARSTQGATFLVPSTASSAEQHNLRSPSAIEDQDNIFADLESLSNRDLGSLESIQHASISEIPQAATADDHAVFTTDFSPWDIL